MWDDYAVRLPDPRQSCAVLIGTSTYESGALPDLPAVRENLRGLADALTNPALVGLDRERCAIVTNSTVRDAYRAIKKGAEEAADTLLVYLAGHGLVEPIRAEPYLAVTETDPDDVRVSALRFSVIRDLILDSSATNRILIFDCCFGTPAATGFLATQEQAIISQIEIAGTYALGFATQSVDEVASFTGALLNALNAGIPGGPEHLTLGALYRHLRSVFVARGLPPPQQRGTDTADQLMFGRNPAYQPPPRLSGPTLPPWLTGPAPPSGRKRVMAGRIIAMSSAGAITAGSILLTLVLSSSTSSGLATGPTTNAAPATTSYTATPNSTITTDSTTTAIPPPFSPPPDFDPHRVPMRVFNNSTINGLGAQATSAFRAGGWNVVEVENYSQGNILTTTAYYRPGTDEEAAAKALAAQFGMRADFRFPGIANFSPGVLVIVTADFSSK